VFVRKDPPAPATPAEVLIPPPLVSTAPLLVWTVPELELELAAADEVSAEATAEADTERGRPRVDAASAVHLGTLPMVLA